MISPRVVRSYARELRTAVKASEGTANSNLLTGYALADSSNAGSHRQFIEEAKKQLRAEKEKTGVQEKSEQMVECRGGSADETLAPVATDMPVGARCQVAGCWYTLRQDANGVFLEPTEDSKRVALTLVETE